MRFFSRTWLFSSSSWAAEAPPPAGRLRAATGALEAEIIQLKLEPLIYHYKYKCHYVIILRKENHAT